MLDQTRAARARSARAPRPMELRGGADLRSIARAARVCFRGITGSLDQTRAARARSAPRGGADLAAQRASDPGDDTLGVVRLRQPENFAESRGHFPVFGSCARMTSWVRVFLYTTRLTTLLRSILAAYRFN